MSQEQVPNLSGLWEYWCKALEGQFENGFVERGGIIYIEQTQDIFGIHLIIEGHRLWGSKRNKNDDIVKIVNPEMPIWRATGGFEPAGTSIHFSYQTVGIADNNGGTRDLFLIGDLEAKIHNGSFFQTIKSNGATGTVKIKRMGSPRKFKWDGGLLAGYQFPDESV